MLGLREVLGIFQDVALRVAKTYGQASGCLKNHGEDFLCSKLTEAYATDESERELHELMTTVLLLDS